MRFAEGQDSQTLMLCWCSEQQNSEDSVLSVITAHLGGFPGECKEYEVLVAAVWNRMSYSYVALIAPVDQLKAEFASASLH